jgi:hypothetical protein
MPKQDFAFALLLGVLSKKFLPMDLKCLVGSIKRHNSQAVSEPLHSSNFQRFSSAQPRSAFQYKCRSSPMSGGREIPWSRFVLVERHLKPWLPHLLFIGLAVRCTAMASSLLRALPLTALAPQAQAAGLAPPRPSLSDHRRLGAPHPAPAANPSFRCGGHPAGGGGGCEAGEAAASTVAAARHAVRGARRR